MASSSNTETDVGNSRWYCHICEDETEAVSEVIDWLCSGGDSGCSESAVRISLRTIISRVVSVLWAQALPPCPVTHIYIIHSMIKDTVTL